MEGMMGRYKKRDSKFIEPENRIKRICNKCDKSFIADGRFNRTCKECTYENKWLMETHTPEALLWGWRDDGREIVTDKQNS